ncbi:hypothetical protein TNCV_1141281 [Trichonephila clavipes]|nr:hypothetical protein TNCV_1141281 [Trichonephila clavipes]
MKLLTVISKVLKNKFLVVVSGVASPEWALYQNVWGSLTFYDYFLTQVGAPEAWRPRIINTADTAVGTLLVELRTIEIPTDSEGHSLNRRYVPRSVHYEIVMGYSHYWKQIPRNPGQRYSTCGPHAAHRDFLSDPFMAHRSEKFTVSSTSLDHGSKLRGPSPKALV